MKRDMDLIRTILFAIEADGAAWDPEQLVVDGRSSAEVGYHVLLAVEGGLVVGQDVTGLSGSPEAIASRLTWAGHDFLDAARDESRWKEVRQTVAQTAGSATFQVIVNMLTGLLNRQLGISP